jgi:hypothetical protein
LFACGLPRVRHVLANYLSKTVTMYRAEFAECGRRVCTSWFVRL